MARGLSIMRARIIPKSARHVIWDKMARRRLQGQHSVKVTRLEINGNIWRTAYLAVTASRIKLLNVRRPYRQ